MSTFITRLHGGDGDGPRLAVKDLIDVQGVSTTAGSRAVARSARPAVADAACLRGSRDAGARIVGKTNLHELAVMPFGVNPWYGTPVNPLDARRIPGGSSSGSAVAVATGEADVALGTDTGGSVRIPAACCGVAGLKTTYGRIPMQGVWPLAPSLDTVGPMATSIAGLALGMSLLEPGFRAAPSAARMVGRLRTEAASEIEAAVDIALVDAGFEVVALELPDWGEALDTFTTIFVGEFWESDHHLLEHRDDLGEDVLMALDLADSMRAGLEDARGRLAAWRGRLRPLFEEVELLALPTLPVLPPSLEDVAKDQVGWAMQLSRHTAPFNAAGVPCVAMPVPLPRSRIPASLQLVGPDGGEELLLATAAVVEETLRAR